MKGMNYVEGKIRASGQVYFRGHFVFAVHGTGRPTDFQTLHPTGDSRVESTGDSRVIPGFQT